MLRRTVLLLTLSVALLPGTCSAAEVAGFRLSMTTKLGAKMDFDVDHVGFINGVVLERFAWATPADIAGAFLAMERDDGSTILVPWTNVGKVSMRDKKQVITIKGQKSEYLGRISTSVTTKEQPNIYCCLDQARAIEVIAIEAPRSKQPESSAASPKGAKSAIWELSSQSLKLHTSPVTVTAPHFESEYYQRSIFINGSDYQRESSPKFSVQVDGESILGEIGQFAELGFQVVKKKEKDVETSSPLLTVKANDADAVTGVLKNVYNNEKAHWRLRATLDDGCFLLLPEHSSWTLNRIEPKDVNRTYSPPM